MGERWSRRDPTGSGLHESALTHANVGRLTRYEGLRGALERTDGKLKIAPGGDPYRPAPGRDRSRRRDEMRIENCCQASSVVDLSVRRGRR